MFWIIFGTDTGRVDLESHIQEQQFGIFSCCSYRLLSSLLHMLENTSTKFCKIKDCSYKSTKKKKKKNNNNNNNKKKNRTMGSVGGTIVFSDGTFTRHGFSEVYIFSRSA